MTKKSYNKFVATAATATLVASAIAPVAASADSKQFTDVNERYAPAVDYVVSKGVNGKTSTQFGVQDSIKRVDAAVFIANALDLNKPGSPDAGFSDVPARAQDAVNALKAKGIINGKTETRFGANDVLTRGEVALILANAYDLKGDANSVKFTDVNKNRYGAAVAGLVDAGVTQGISETKFGTDNPVKRGDLAVFLYGLSDQTETPEVPSTDGITSAKALNDTRIEVEFGKAISKDFIREAERSGKYFAVYTAGNTLPSKETVTSTKINFSKDGKTATFDLDKKDAVESGKKYYVVLMDGPNNKVADTVHKYGPVELKESAARPDFEVSATADKIFVDFGTKMKDSALKVDYYTVFDNGGKELGPLKDFLTKDAQKEGKWVELNDKAEVEFKLGTDSAKKLSAGKTYKLKVSDKVKTDDNKTLSEDERTIRVDTPSLADAQPEAKIARVTGTKQIKIVFDKDIDAQVANINFAQLNLETSTGKTVNLTGVDAKRDSQALNTLVLDLKVKATEDELDSGTTYNIDMPSNIVKNGIFINAMNKETTGLEAKAQENVSIKEMSAEIVANEKNTGQADLVLTFDQVPVLNKALLDEIELFDGRDKYEFKGSLKDAKIYGGDDEGKSIIIEDIGKVFERNGKGLVVRGDKTYDIEIAANKVVTDSFDKNQAKNKSKLKASTSGVSVSQPVLDKVYLESAEKIVFKFKEDIKGNMSASDLEIAAYVANRSDIFATQKLETISGSGYYSVDISGKELTIEAKDGVKFPTSLADLSFKIDENTFTNSDGNNGNKEITKSKNFVQDKDVIDNAAPEIVSAYVKKGNEIEVTFTEAIKQQGSNKEIGSLFFTDGGEEATEGTYFSLKSNKNIATITFKDNFIDNSTDLSVVELEYKSGNTFYLQDGDSNKVESATLTGFFKDGKISDGGNTTDPEEPGNGGEETPGEGDVVTASEIGFTLTKNDIQKSTNVVFNTADLPSELKGKDLVIEYKGKKYNFIENEFKPELIFATLPALLEKSDVNDLKVSAK